MLLEISKILIAQINNFPDVEVCHVISPIAHIVCWIQGISIPVIKSADTDLCTESPPVFVSLRTISVSVPTEQRVLDE